MAYLRVRVARHEVHLEILVVVDHLIAHCDHPARPLPHQVLPQHAKEDGVDRVDLLDDKCTPESNLVAPKS